MEHRALEAAANRVRTITESNYTLVVGICAFAVWLGLVGGDVSVFEDPLITLRFSQNLAQYGSWSFNPDTTPVQGATSFTWMLLNAAMLFVFSNPLDNVQMLGFWISLAAFILLALAVRRIHPCLGIIALAMISLTPDLAEYVYNGYESPLLWLFECLLLYLLVIRAHSERFRSYILSAAVGFILALAAMTRPEAILFIAMIGVWVVPSDKTSFAVRLNHMLVASIVFAAFTGLFYGLVYTIYGLPFPSSYYLKVNQFRHEILAMGWMYLRAFFSAQPAWLAALVIILPIGRRLVPWGVRLPALIGIGVYTFFILYVGGDHPHNPGCRFFLFMVPFWWFAALASLATFSGGKWGQPLLTTIAYVSIAGLCVTAIVQVPSKLRLNFSDTHGVQQLATQPACRATIGSVYWGSENVVLPFPGFSSEKFPSVHDTVAVWLLKQMGGPYTLASESAGHLAYFSGPDVKFIDLVGLGTYECIQKLHGAKGVREYVIEERPDVVLLEVASQDNQFAFTCYICNDIMAHMDGYRLVAFVNYVSIKPNFSNGSFGCGVFVRSERLDRFADLTNEGEIREFPFAYTTYKLRQSRILDWEKDLTHPLCESARNSD